MKIRTVAKIIAVLLIAAGILLALVRSTKASTLDCGMNISVSMFRVDAAGFAPRLAKGDPAQFNCVTAYDPNFYAQRFRTPNDAANYYYTLLGQAWGVVFTPLATP